jgi:PAS domain S-box-containing protein
MPKAFTWSIRKSLTVIVLLATLPAMAIIAITGLESKKHAEQDAREKTLSLVRSLAAMQMNVANEAQALLNALARTPAVKNFDIKACNDLFSELHKGRYNFVNLLLARHDGSVIASGIPQLIGINISDREYFKQTLATKRFNISDLIISRGIFDPVQVYIYPVLSSVDQVESVLAFALSTSKFGELLIHYDLQEGSRVTFVDSTGIRMFAFPEHEMFPLGKPYHQQNWEIINNLSEDEGTFSGTRLGNEKVLFAYSRLRLLPSSPPYMTITATIPEERVFKEANSLLLRNMVLLALAAVTALAITWLIGNAAVLRGLRGLMSATSRLGAGDLTARADTGQGSSELRTLAVTFNEMALALETRQDELRESADTINAMRIMLNNILESMPSAIIGLDKDDLVTHWNSGAEKLSGKPREAALGKHLEAVFPWLSNQVRSQKRAQDAPPLVLEKLRFPGESDIRYVDVLAYSLASNGADGAVVRIDDVTRRVQLEEMMVQTEKMSTVGSLAAGMAHDINNPLAGILQSVQNIQRRVSPELPPNIKAAEDAGCDITAIRSYLDSREILSFLSAIKESGERASTIVKNMLGFIRRSSSDHIPASLADLVDRTVAIATADFDIKKKYDFRGIEIIKEYQPDMPKVPCSPSEVEQVVYNLLTNSAQAMGNPPVTGRAPKLILRVYQDGLNGVIEVEDNGPGMDEEVRKRVFEPLFSTKAPGEGTGLGLAVAYFIVVNSYTGEILVESEQGRGTRFIVRLPIKPQSQPADPPLDRPDPSRVQ